MNEVLRYLLDSSGPLVPRSTLEELKSGQISQNDWQNYVDDVKEMVVTNPGMTKIEMHRLALRALITNVFFKV